jgi:hypothetical protein
MSATTVLMVINTTGLQYDDRLRKEVGSLRAQRLDVSILGLEYANTAASTRVYGDVPAKTINLRSGATISRWGRSPRCSRRFAPFA